MIKTSRKPILNSHTVQLHFRHALFVLAGAVTIMGLAAPATAARSAPAGTAPPNQAPRSAVAVAFDPTGSGFAFYQGKDHAIYMRSFFGARAWSAQTRIGGHILGAPSAAVARTTLVVAARGTDNTLRLRMMHNGTWSRWLNWGGKLSASPAITGTRSGRIDAFVRGPGHALWVRSLRPGQPLTKWKRLGGRLSTAPAAVAVGNNSFEVAAGGPGHFVWSTSSISNWAWTRIRGHRTGSAPAIGYIPQSNGAWVLIRGTDNGLWGKGFGGGRSTKWVRIGSKLISGAPTAAGTRLPRPHIITVVRDLDRAPWTTRYPVHGGDWSAFTRAWIPRG
jgi:hypothetical protein